MSNSENDGPEQPTGPDHERPGYGKQPMIRRFRECGNTRGRPKGAKNRKTIVREVAEELHVVVENGKRRPRSTLELVLLRLRSLALEEKNVRAFGEWHRLTKAYEPEVVDDKAGYMLAPAEMTAEEWVAEQEELNKTRKPPPDYEPDPSELE